MQASTNTRATARDIDPTLLHTCQELQQDELLALEAIYERNFAATRNDQGEHVLTVTVEVKFSDETDVVVVEEGIHQTVKSPKPVPRDRSKDFARQQHRHRGRRNAERNGNFASKRDSLSLEGSILSMSNVKEALPAVENIATPPTFRVERSATLLYLPAVEIVATLPLTYPVEEPPSLHLKAAWISGKQRELFLDRFNPIWQNDSCMFLIVEELTAIVEEGRLGSPVKLLDQYKIYSDSESTPRTTLYSQIVTHDRLARHSTFSSESFDCGICLETKKGARCSQLKSCGHVFCVECLHAFFEINIREGTVSNVSCPDQECIKGKAKDKNNAGVVSYEEVEAVVGKELADRHKWLVQKQKIESGTSILSDYDTGAGLKIATTADPTVTYCPRETCNAAVPKDKDDSYERLRVCPACSYSFCVYCRRTYHGMQSRCVFNQASSIVDKYVNGDHNERAALESRYGKTNVKKLVEVYLEEQANAKWIEENSTRCPDCHLDIERSMGCAHMTCARCSCHFCFRCGCRLNAKDPYAHYSSKSSSCYNRLFDYVPSEDQMNEALFAAMMG